MERARRRYLQTDVALRFQVLLWQQIVGSGADGRRSKGWGGEGLGAGSWVRSRRWFYHRNGLQYAIALRFQVRLRQIVGNAEGQLARGWGVEGLQYFGKLNVHLFEFSNGMAQSSEAVRVVGWICVGLVDLLVVVGVIVVDERGHEVGSTGMRKGVGG